MIPLRSVACKLFDALSPTTGTELRRADLREGAIRLGWGWREAALYAVLDRLALEEPLSRQRFAESLSRIAAEGPFGEVLREAPPPEAGKSVRANAALLIIDPQRSFTEGAWKRSIGPGGEVDVEPIRRAFDQCAALLRRCGDDVRAVTMFTRCPFPPDSYAWDARFDGVIDELQPYFIKPGNSALWPPTNGSAEWIASMLSGGKRTLVVAGCTLNSCVRVSAIEIARRFAQQGLRVVVDPSLAGARASNYRPSTLFEGLSPVESALQQMSAAGVAVVPEGAAESMLLNRSGP